jgi:hypothetical protein
MSRSPPIDLPVPLGRSGLILLSKSREVASSSSSNEEIDASSEEETKDKKEKKGDKRSYNTASYNYDNLSHSNTFTSVPVGSSKKQDIAFKATKKSKSKKVVEESSSEEDDYSNDESTEYDPEEMALFIRRFSKLISKQKFFKRNKKDKFKSKTNRTCYNIGKYGHYIANYPYKRREEDDDKKKKQKEEEKRYKKDKHYKNKAYGEAHIGKE